MKKLFLLLFMLPTLIWAQDDAKYLVGAVPVEGNYVTFRQTIQAGSMSQDDIYEAILLWASQKYQTNQQFPNNKLVTQDKKQGEIGAIGEDFLVFASSFLSLDRSRFYYQLRVICKPGTCNIEMSRLRYWYEEDRNGGQRYRAEELITDEYGLNKKKNKLARVIGKFREKTIDYKDELFKEIANALGASAIIAKTVPATPLVPATQPVEQAPVAVPVATPSQAITPTTNTKGLEGFKQITPEQIPGNIIKLLTNDYMIITAGNDELFNPMAAGWGGLGNLYNRPVAYCFIDPSRYTYGLMQKNDTYTLTFYTPAYQNAVQYCGTHSGRDENKVAGSGLTPITTPSGSKAFAEAWLIIECKKIASQLLTPSSISDANVKSQFPNKHTELFVGEIISVWTK